MGDLKRLADHRELWGILNPFGGIWTPDTFPSPDQAWQHLERFWPNPADRANFRVIRVEKIVQALEPIQDDPNPPSWTINSRRRIRSLQEHPNAR